MIYELINIEKMRRAILYSILMIGVLSFQEIALSRISILGVTAIIYPILPIGIALLQGGMWGLGFGLACGILCDCMFAETLIFYTMLLPTLAFLTTAAEKFWVRREAIAFFFCSTIGIFLTGLFQLVRMLLMYSADVAPMIEVVIIQTLFSSLFIIPMYFPIKILAEKTFR